MSILDDVTNEKVAYSLRKLRSAYAGSAVRIRRDQDSVEADIGFDGSGDFDIAAYNTHLIGSTPDSTIGFIVTWYDQSGAGLDMAQATAGNQPRISLSSFGPSNVTTIDFLTYSTTRFFDAPDLSALTAAEMFIALLAAADAFLGGGWRFGTHGDFTHYTLSNGIIYDGFGTTVRKTTGNPTPDVTVEHIYNVITASGEWTSNINDTQHYTTATNTVAFLSSAMKLGINGANLALNGKLAEFIVFDAKLSSGDHSSVFTDLDDYYIQVPPDTGGPSSFYFVG